MVDLGVGGGLAARGGAARPGVAMTMGMLLVTIHNAEGSFSFPRERPDYDLFLFSFLNDLVLSFFFLLLL